MRSVTKKYFSANLEWLSDTAILPAVLVFGIIIGSLIFQHLDKNILLANNIEPHLVILITAAIFLLASAIPFVPGAEIGIALMVMFGGRVIILVYICMVAALLLAFLTGRYVPLSLIVRMFSSLKMIKVQEFLTKMQHTNADEWIKLLVDRTPGKSGKILTSHRCLVVMTLLNLPGNSLLGGGGGISFICGMSGLFSPLKFALTVAIAVAPVPLVFLLVT